MRKIVFGSLWLLVFTIPLENVFVLEGFGTFNRVIGFVYIGFAMATIVARQEVKAPSATLILAFCFVVWSMASFFWAIDPEISKKGITTLIQLLAFTWLIWEFVDSEADLHRLLTAYILGAFVASASIHFEFTHGIQATYMRYSLPGFNANDIALALAVGIPMAWLMAVRQQRLLLAIPYYLYLPVAFYGIMLTASRAAFVAALVAAIFAVWSFPRQSWSAKLLTLAMTSATVVVLILVVPVYNWERIASIGQELSHGNLNARSYIWWNGFKVFAENPLLGVGVSGFPVAVEKYAYTDLSAHNLFLAVVVGQGIIGLALFLAILIAALRKVAYMSPLYASMWIITFIAWFAGVMTISWAHSKPTWFLIGLLAVQGAQAEFGSRAPQDEVVVSGVPVSSQP